MRRLPGLCLSLLFILTLAACGKQEKAAIAKDLKDKGTLELMQEASEDQYEPPADGRLTEKQIQMYLKVKEHEKKIIQVAKQEAEQHAKKAEKSGEKSLAGMMAGLKTLGSVADMVTADIRAAKELGFNTAEYEWVKEKVMEASGSAMGEKLSESMSSMFDTQIETLNKQLAETTDEQTKQYLKEAIEMAEKGKAEMAAQQEQEDPALTHNKQLVSKHQGALNAIATEWTKFGSEEDQAKAQQSLNEWEQNVEKAKKDAANQ